MTPRRLIAGLAGLGLATGLPGGARANNDLSTSYRAGSISPPAIDGASSSESAALGVNQGRASYRVPLVTPPGLAGLEPGLALTYGGTRSDGEVGAGWSLPVPRLRVRTSGRGGQPRYGVGVTVQGFGGEDLRETGTLADADGDGLAEVAFREERDATYVRYVALSGGGWRADYPDGRKLTLGTDPANRVVRSGQPSQIAEWLPEVLVDPRGNQLRYTWSTAASLHAAAVSPTARYLTEVRYACRDCAADDTYQRVTFGYTPRTAPHRDFGPGFAIETELLLATIDTATVIGGVAQPVRTVSLAYATAGGRPRLATVSVAAADGSSLPAMRFTYGDGRAPASPSRTLTAAPGVALKSGVQAIDVDLDGRVDIADLSSVTSAKWYANTGSAGAGFASASTAVASPPGKPLSATGTTSLDDGNRDSALDVFDLGTSKLFAHDGAGGWDTAGVTATLPPIAWSTNTLRADVDRDGHVDLVDTSAAPWRVYLDDGSGNFTTEIIDCTAATTPTVGGALRASSDGVLTGDVNGDGLLDVVYIQTARTQASVFYGRGRGCWGWMPEDGRGSAAGETVAITSQVSGPTRAATHLADVDGDGHDDLVMFDAGASRLNAWRFTPGSGWSDSGMGGPFVQTITATSGCRLADVDSDGVREAICSSGWKIYDWADEPRHLMVTAENGGGVVSTLRYTTSARVAAAHRAAGTPWTRNVGTALPLVAATEVADGRGNVLVTTYDYRDAAIEVDELEDRAEFAGFAYVAAASVPYLEYGGGTRVADPADPGALTRTWYDLGLADWYLHGARVCEERWPAGAAPASFACGGATGALRRTEDTYAVELDADGIATVVLDARDEHVLDGAATGPRLRTEYAHDAYGNRTQVWAYGRWSGAPDHTGDDEQVTMTNHILDTAAWNLRLPKRVRRGAIDVSGAQPAIDRLEATFFRYDGAADWQAVTAAAGLRTATDRWTHDPLTGAITTDTVEQVTYTAAGLPDVVTNAEGVTAAHAYDADFAIFPARTTLDPGGLALVTETAVDPRTGMVTLAKNPDGTATAAAYDLLGRLVRIVEPGDTAASPTVTRTYTTGAPVSTIVEVRKDGTADGLTTTTRVDGHGRVLCEAKEATATKVDVLAQREYSARGHVVLDWQPGRHAACETAGVGAAGRSAARAHDALTVDALGRRVRREHEPSGTFRSWSYAALAVTEADENDNDAASPHAGTTTTRTSDGRGRIVGVTEQLDGDGDGVPEPHTTAYAWTVLDQLAAVTDPLGAEVFAAVYDSRGRRRRVADPDRGAVISTYDAMDRVATSVDARGATLAYDYDAAGRVASIAESTNGVAGPTTTYAYDAPAPGYDAATCRYTAGRLARVTDAAGSTVYCYDDRGRGTRIDRKITALGGGALRLDRTFDALGRVKSLTHPDGTRLNWTYGKDSRASRLTVKGGGGTAPVYDVVASAVYDGAGQPTLLTLGNGAAVSLSYDDRLRPLRSVVTTGGATVQDLTLTLDGVGNVGAITDLAGTHLSATFGHDAADRLVSAAGDRFGGHTASYAYDVRGNLTSKTSTDAGSALDVGAIAYRTDRIHAVASARGETFAYDAAGNLSGDGDFTYTYDARGMLATATPAGGSAPAVTNVYDHAGRRAVKDRAAGDDVYYFPEAGLEIRGGVHVKYLDFGGRTVARLAGTFASAAAYGEAMRFLVADHLGGPSLVLDAAGSVVERWSGHPHGEDNPAPFVAAGLAADFKPAGDPLTVLARRFQGREVNAEDGTYDFGARVYRPDLGRFMSPDSIVPDPGSSQSWNRYAFARNNPLARIDPSGHEDEVATTPVAAAPVPTAIPDQAFVDGFTDQLAAAAAMPADAKLITNEFLSRYIADPAVQPSFSYSYTPNVSTATATASFSHAKDGFGGSGGAGVTGVINGRDAFSIEVTRVQGSGSNIQVTRDRLDLEWGLENRSMTESVNLGGEAKGGKLGGTYAWPTHTTGTGYEPTAYRFRSVTTGFDVDVYHIRSVTADSETWRTQGVLRPGTWNATSTDNGNAGIGAGWDYEQSWNLYQGDVAGP